MSRRLLLFLFGALPSTALAFLAIAGAYACISEFARYHSIMALGGLAYCAAGASGSVGLWTLALRNDPLTRGRRDASLMGVLLMFGVASACVLLTSPLWAWRLLAFSPIVSALCVFPSIVRGMAAKENQTATNNPASTTK